MLLAALLSGCSLTKSSRYGLRTGERDFSKDELAQLTRTTTVLFLRSEDGPRRDEFEEAIERAWHLTEIEVAPFGRAGEYADSTKYSYLVIEGETLSSYPVIFYHLTLLTRSPSGSEDQVVARSVAASELPLRSTASLSETIAVDRDR